MAYVCKEPGCSDSVAWHLQHGDLDCIGDNKDAVAAYANAAEALKEQVALQLSGAAELTDAFATYEASN